MEKEVEGTGMRERGPKRWPECGSRGEQEWWGEELEGGLEDPAGNGDRVTPRPGIYSCRWIWAVSPLKTLGHGGAAHQHAPVS